MLAEVEAKEDLTFSRTIRAGAADVFHAFVSRGAIRGWLCHAADIAPQLGGRVYLWWNDGYYAAGEFTEYHPHERLAFTWNGRGDPSPGRVEVVLEEKVGTTTVTVTHFGSEGARAIKERWEEGLENLQALVETGNDLRFMRRPMFGLSGAEIVDKDVAARLGLSVEEGMYLQGLVDGMGAQAAGLQAGDVLVRLGGKPITGYESLGLILSGYKAGDQVPVEIYRGPEKLHMTVTLSGRPVPQIPESTVELARLLAASYETLNAELDEIVAGITEEEASYSPAPTEWSAKEVLAHLIVLEQDLHAWLAAVLDGDESTDPFHSNVPFRIFATSSVYTTLPELVEQLKRTQEVTLVVARDLPAAAVSRKYIYNQLAQWWTSFEDHTREHFAEIKALAEACRATK